MVRDPEDAVGMIDAEWQMVGQDDWIFGEKIRGIVRVQLANVYYDEDCNSPKGGWAWMLFGRAHDLAVAAGKPIRGTSASRTLAIWDAEEAMGVALR